MSEFNFKTLADDYKIASEEVPETEKVVEILCTMITKAKLVNADPITWEQVPESPMQCEVKLWRNLPEVKVVEEKQIES